MAEPLDIEVFWQPQQGPARLCRLRLPAGSTVGDAVAASGLLPTMPDHGETVRAALWGRLRPDSTPLHDGDRVDLLRPLLIDPRQARRLRAARRRAR